MARTRGDERPRIHPAGLRPQLVVQRLGRFVAEDAVDASRKRGERLPTLIASATGLPLRLALHWSFAHRRLGVSSKTIEGALRHIGHLYEALDDKFGIDLDALVFAGAQPTTTEVEAALRYIETRGEDPREPMHADEPSAAATAATAGTPTRRAAMQPSAFNRMAFVWCEFLRWTTNPGNFRESSEIDETLQAFEERKAREEAWRAWFEAPANRRAVPSRTKTRKYLTPHELEAIEHAVGPDVHRRYPRVFSRNTVVRNWVMYATARWFGIRRSELLKLCVTDVPGVPDPTVVSHRLEDERDCLMIFRRPDDPDDPRRTAPLVKTAERALIGPQDLLDSLRSYVEAPPPRGRKSSVATTKYLFVTASGAPVSIDTANDIIRRIGTYAAQWFEAHYPDEVHTLNRLTWHRLRHTRAMELLPEFYDSPDADLNDFVKYFGWASILSAAPYVDELRKRRANDAVRSSLERADDRARQHHVMEWSARGAITPPQGA